MAYITGARPPYKGMPATTETRTAALREIAQGEGLNGGSSINRTALWRLGVDTYSEVEEVVKLALERAPQTPQVLAFKNAIRARKKSVGWMNLTERRGAYLSTDEDVSYRTLIRYEEAGAEVVAAIITDILNPEPPTRRDIPDDLDQAELVQALKERLLAAEDQIDHLRGLIHDIIRLNPRMNKSVRMTIENVND